MPLISGGMRAVATMDTVSLNKCLHCGTSFEPSSREHVHDDYCCEGCYLEARKSRDRIRDERFALVEALAAALDAREHETGLHSKRVACHTLVLAKHFTSDPHELQQIYYGALLHDIGKIGIPDAILLKQGALTPSEWEVMRTHPEIGHRILAKVPHMQEAAEIILCHEERFDGTGYPRGLAGSAIPLYSRLFAVIDALDAITSDRPYRKALSFDSALEEIRRGAGTQFDPVAMGVFALEEVTLRNMVELKCGTAEAAFPPGASVQKHEHVNLPA